MFQTPNAKPLNPKGNIPATNWDSGPLHQSLMSLSKQTNDRGHELTDT